VHQFVELRVSARHPHPPMTDDFWDGNSSHRVNCQHALYQLFTFYRRIHRHSSSANAIAITESLQTYSVFGQLISTVLNTLTLIIFPIIK